MNNETLFEMEWAYLINCLPPEVDLEESARRYGAITRRRSVGDASTLLRLAMGYGVCGMSLRQTAAWAEVLGLASISNVALLKRLRGCTEWLGYLIAAKLADTAPAPSISGHGMRIRLVDATTIKAPGSNGTDFRLHLGFDLGRMAIDHVEVTDRRGGESLRRFKYAPGELVIGDAGYAHRPSLYAVTRTGADFLVRHNWWALPLTTPDGEPLEVAELVRGLPDAGACEFPVLVKAAANGSTPAFPVRLILLRKSEAAAERAREKVLRERSRKGRELDPRALELAAYICLVTSLKPEAVTAEEVLDLYRFRWQVELAFKRLKGLLDLGQVPSGDPQLGKTVIFAKLLAALIVSDYTGRYLDFFPWGYRLRQAPAVTVAD